MHWIIIGNGSIAQKHIRHIKQIWPDHKVTLLILHRGLRESDDEFTTVDHVLYNRDDALKLNPDFVLIATPATEHVNEALFWNEQKIPLFIEKPLSHSLEESQKLQDNLKSIIMVGYVLRFFPVYQELKKIINNKTYGTVTSFETTVGSYLPSWRPNIDYKKSVSANTALGGGTLLELSHEIDLTLWCLGFPQYLNAHIENTGELEIDCEDVGDIKLTYNGGLTAKIHMDFLKKIPERKTTITFEKATITCDAIAGTLEITALNSDGDNDTKTLNFKPENPQQPFLDEIKHFVTYARENTTPDITIEDGINVLRIIEGAKTSSSQNKQVEL